MTRSSFFLPEKRFFDMGCPPVRGDTSLRASGLSYVQVDTHGITIFTTYISVDIAHRAKVGNGGNSKVLWHFTWVFTVRLGVSSVQMV